MVVVYLQGGLGNQLFQYAAGRRLAVRHGCDLVINPYWFGNPKERETRRDLELYDFNVKARVANGFEQKLWRLMHTRLGGLWGRLFSMSRLHERGVDRRREFAVAPDNSYLVGFWQCEDYFSEIREIILDEFTLSSPATIYIKQLADEMDSCNSVALHVRRGDYLTNKTAANFHGVCPISYYMEAVSIIAERVSEPVFYIFSDDIEWARNHLQFDCPAKFMDSSSLRRAASDIFLMSKCRHHIIANSSFSWWGAWLKRYEEGIVIAPTPWFRAQTNVPKIVPDRWLKVPINE